MKLVKCIIEGRASMLVVNNKMAKKWMDEKYFPKTYAQKMHTIVEFRNFICYVYQSFSPKTYNGGSDYWSPWTLTVLSAYWDA